MNFVCPKCKSSFAVGERGAAVCSLGHSFDRSREGYYNLFLSNVGGVHGDNKEMVLARREFLDFGIYRPLAELVSSLAAESIESGLLIDAGCGEGYYTSYLESAFVERKGAVSISGFDISKAAVRLAAKRCKSVEFAVASSYEMPFRDFSASGVVNIFSPLAIEETKRVLSKNGKFIMAIPGRRHLFGLKAAIYDNPYENRPEGTSLEGFRLIKEERLFYEAELVGQKMINSLFMMTPYAYRTSAEGRRKVASLESLKTEIEFIVLVYEKEI